MRGHIGFKIRRFFNTEVLVTQEVADVLAYPTPAPQTRVTRAATDVLAYPTPAPQVRVTRAATDVLAYPTPATQIRVTRETADVLAYSTPTTQTRLTRMPIDVFAWKTTVPAKPSAPPQIDEWNGTTALFFNPVINNGLPITGYVVQWSSVPDEWTTANVSVAEVNAFCALYNLPFSSAIPIGGLPNNATYVFRFAAVNALGAGPWSDVSQQFITHNRVFGDELWATLDVDNTYSAFTILDFNNATVTYQSGYNYFSYTVYDSWANHSLTPLLFALRVTVNPTDPATTENTNSCVSNTYGENGENVSGCLYSYDFQYQEVGDSPYDWTSISTPSYSLYSGSGPSATLVETFPAQPYVYVAPSTATSAAPSVPFMLHTPQNVSYRFRCIVTRKTDNVQFIAYNPYLKITVA